MTILDLANSRSKSCPRSNSMVSHLQPGEQSICLRFVSWQSNHFWLRYIKFHTWPWEFKVKIMLKIDQNLIRWSTGQGHQSCQQWTKSLKLFGCYGVNKSQRPAAAALSGGVRTGTKTLSHPRYDLINIQLRGWMYVLFARHITASQFILSIPVLSILTLFFSYIFI